MHFLRENQNEEHTSYMSASYMIGYNMNTIVVLSTFFIFPAVKFPNDYADK